MNNKKIVLIGPYPPPVGGVSVHIKRLKDLLDNEYIFQYIDESKTIKLDKFNVRSLNILRYLKVIYISDYVHIHSGHVLFRIIHFLTSKILNKNIVVTYHSYSNTNVNIFDKIIILFSDKIICVNKEISKKLKRRDIFIKEAFLPPDLTLEPQLPKHLINWLNIKRSEGYVICCANAWRLIIHNKVDLYGLDLCIESANELMKKGHKVAFVFVISDKNGEIEIEEYKTLIKQYQIEDIFYIQEESISFPKLITNCQIVLRPTNTDGDALTIREALYLNKCIIASNVVERPNGVRLFKNRSKTDLTNKIIECLKISPLPIHQSVKGDINEYLNFYKKEIFSF